MRALLMVSMGVSRGRWHRLCANQGAAIMGLIALASGGCAPEETYDVITNVDPSKGALVDDTAPAETAFDPSLSYRGRNGAELNHSRDRYRFDVAAFRDDAERIAAERLYPSHGAFLQDKSGQATLPSVQTMGTYVKQLDDTIYAGVERAVQDGTPALASKRLVLTGALEHLQKNRDAAADEALVLVAAALRLGAAPGDEPVVPADLVARVDALTAGFLATPAVAKPQGFYTWSPELTKIWQQDRLLQTVPDARATSCALASAIGAEPTRRAAYVRLVQLYDRLTNPVKSSLVDVLDQAAAGTCAGGGAPLAFLGRSATPEVALFNQLYPNGVPASADLMGDLIAAIRAGTVDLTPKPADGWYAHQLFGLETLLVTDRSEERRKIAFMTKYKKRLQEAFATMLVQHRETHVKQADEARTTSAPAPPPTPDFRVEPMATVYVRHARSYVFLERALDEVLGPEVLDQAVVVDAKGPGTETLRKRIQVARDRFFGLYIVAAQDIGLPFALSVEGDPVAADIPKLGEDAAKWLSALSSDPVAQSDVRVLVPIAQIDAAHTKYWAVIGVRGTLAGYSYLKGADTSAPLPADQSRRLLPTEQFLEVVSSATPLTREEYRALCDEAKTAEGIAAALSARLGSRSPTRLSAAPHTPMRVRSPRSPRLFGLARASLRGQRGATFLALLVLGGSACAKDETYERVSTPNPVQAATLDDTAPLEAPFDPSLSFVDRNGLEGNHSQHRYRFDVAAYQDDAEKAAAEILYPSHGAFLQANPRAETLPSVQTLGTYVKQIDDMILAGVERAAQDGTPTLASKRLILTGMVDYLAAHRSADGDEALALVAAALRLGGSEAIVPPELEDRVAAVTKAFVDRPVDAKPQGFYGWSSELTKIWQQDRLLQTIPQERATSCALATAIAAEPARRAAYERLVRLSDRLTNPVPSSLVELLDEGASATCASGGKPQAFLGRSATPEVALFRKLYPHGVPLGADLMGDLIRGIREGTLDLAPAKEDGFYAHQLFGLETLLVTDRSEERRKIAFMSRYKARLTEAFTTMLVQHRETHVKQADVAPIRKAGIARPQVPDFRVEPLATVYVRHARSYVFLERVLDEVLGAAVLDQAFATGAQGVTTRTLRATIHEARDRFFGLYIVAAQDVGLPFALGVPGDPAKDQIGRLGEGAAKWLDGLALDPVVQSDVRVLVPIAVSPSGQAQYWAVIGVRGTLAGYSYVKGDSTAPPEIADQSRRLLPTEQFLQVVSSAVPPSREEFRALCDEAKTPEGIAKALAARP